MAEATHRNGWHVERTDAAVTVSRGRPVRFDLAVEARFPVMGRERLARQIRQDMWRALQRLRGFRPAVQVMRDGGGLRVVAGGAVDAPFPRQRAEAVIRDILETPANRARWQRFAGGRHDT